jgi:cysteine desulfurase
VKRIYLDYNSTTPVDPSVLTAITPYLTGKFGNPSNLHAFGRDAREGIEDARTRVAGLINARPEDVFFTGSGTESDNWALKGIAAARRDQGRHIVISPIEHSAVLGTADWLGRQGWEITRLPVDNTGLVDPEEVRRALRPDTVLVSVMLANNEVGTIQPVSAIAAICRSAGVVCHTDAVAAAGKIGIDVQTLGVDLLTISAHKLHGPKGAGCLWVRPGTVLHPLIHGGHQERGLYAGTENITGIVGLGAACTMVARTWRDDIARVTELRDLLQDGILSRVPEIRVNGHPRHRLGNTLHIGVGYVEGEALLVSLDLEGIAVASGSACSAGEGEPSATLQALRIPPQYVNSPIRFSLGRENTRDEIEHTVDVFAQVVRRLRDISPIWKDRGRRFFTPEPPRCTTGEDL